MQVKLAWEHVESEYMRAVETCGAEERHTLARTQDVALGRQRRFFYVSLSVLAATALRSIARIG